MSLASEFEILPAIDLRGGRVVRLEQGDFARETSFSSDPVSVAVAFADAGARWLHVVDLDGARAGTPVHDAVIRRIVASVGDRLHVEIAGGLRTIDAIASVLATGASRAIVGTRALQDPTFAGLLVRRFGGDAVAVALDVRAGSAVGDAWQPGAPGRAVEDALASLADVGVATFEVTAIERDGSTGGPDLALYERLLALDRGAIIASAGIATTADLDAVRSLGCAGAIIGRALYDGRLDLTEILPA
ncbi:MAG: 1-(5-phosphoribosyl)-5-[(5-phosphoribosylamino)methylideneamino] imidazole-4-carboxamide isomerase [Chloroflexota bacterium]|nr:1-(5-phosphoribosyl)-5-[(5-phosphoribosylamino)methylideneamino] imidazole-4-carboxamide isomerase [Chloroflexota bacterium]